MLDEYDLWAYRDDHNCWDYVREILIAKANIPARDVPKFGISPKDKINMTRASNNVASAFVRSGPEQYAVACHYKKRTLIHVGIVENGKIRHTGEGIGTRRDKIEDFEAMADTVYMLHQSLWQQ